MEEVEEEVEEVLRDLFVDFGGGSSFPSSSSSSSSSDDVAKFTIADDEAVVAAELASLFFFSRSIFSILRCSFDPFLCAVANSLLFLCTSSGQSMLKLPLTFCGFARLL